MKVADPLFIETLNTAFLGEGGMGRVIAVVSDYHDHRTSSSNSLNTLDSNALMALKITQEENGNQLATEFGRLKHHKDTCGCNLIVHPIDDSFRSIEANDIPGLHGFMMNTIGEGHVSKIEAKEMLYEIFYALYKLHTHDPPIIHGDARLPNLIKYNGQLMWIDLYFTSAFSEQGKLFDMKTLVDSIDENYLNDPSVLNCIIEYSKAPSESNLIQIVSKLEN